MDNSLLVYVALSDKLLQDAIKEFLTLKNVTVTSEITNDGCFDILVVDDVSFSEQKSEALILLVSDEKINTNSGGKVLQLPSGTSLQILQNIIAYLCEISQEFRKHMGDSQKLQNKIEDEKIINRAKLILVSRYKMDEKTSHKYIEKQAMDARLTRRAVAERIIAIYEDLN